MLISVCIPTFNQEKYIKNTVKSVLQQSIQPDEIIISDDCSTDQTPTILQALAQEIPILKVVRQPFNLGMNRNTDACLRLGKGDLIVKLDSDDCLAPTYIQKLSELLVKHPKAGYAHGAVQEIDQHGNFTRLRRLARKSVFQSGDDALQACINGYQVAANIIIFRRDALNTVGYISSRTNFAEDYHLSASLAAKGYGNVYCDEVLSYYRVWSDAGNSRQRRKLDEITGIRKIFEDVLEPAYKRRKWSVATLNDKRKQFACRHANCLSWKLYTLEEKKELNQSLCQLSPHPRARLSAWLYLNNCGIVEDFFQKIISLPKATLKTILLRLK